MTMGLLKSLLRASLTSARDVIVHGFTPLGAFLIMGYLTRHDTAVQQGEAMTATCAVLVCVLWVDVKKGAP